LKKHTKIYLNHFGYGIEDFIPCTVCNSQAVDIHHIDARKMGGSNSKDFIENLAALCRLCHDKAESNKKFNQQVKQKHLKLL
jgi:5-methylcytosine-specific restriction endonuclease McrA|tara:strand:+ start:3129 stop:3374 length:246 start_codon:yes stop_codon:yes gene_type:complete